MSTTASRNLAIDWLICHFRWLWLIVAFFIAQITADPALIEDFTPVYILIGLGVIYNGAILGMLFVGWYPVWASTTAAALDTVLAIALMWATGGYASAQMPTMLFVVVTVALRINTEAGLLAATPMALALAVSIILSGATELRNLIDITIKGITLFSVPAVAGYIQNKTLEGAKLEDKEEIQRLRTSNERARAIYEMANTLSSTLNYRTVLKAMVDLAYMALSEADRPAANGSRPGQDGGIVGMVLLFDENGPRGKLKLESGRNIPRIDEGKKVSADQGVLQAIIYRAEAVTVSDLQSDPVLQEFSALQNCRSMVCAPLRAGFDTYGLVLFASPTPGYYRQTHATLLSTFCNQAIIALQNAQLYEDLELEQKKLLEKEAQARRELARNLHDGPTQDVSAIVMDVNFVQTLLKREGDIQKSLDELVKIEAKAQKTVQNLRTALFTLRPVVLETQGLEAALGQYADRLKDLEKLNVKVDVQGYDKQLTIEAEGVLFAIIEEAINNAKKYAEAELIQIRTRVEHNCVIVEVEDNGQGFDVAATQSTYDQRASLGLINMQERTQMIGGRFHLTSAVGKGTIVRVEVPIARFARV
jgi:signal transduction histidine kinase